MAKTLLMIADDLNEAAKQDTSYLEKRDKSSSAVHKYGTSHFDREKPSEIISHFEACLNTIRDDDATEIATFLRACVKHGEEKVLDKLALPILTKTGCVNWPERSDLVVLLLKSISRYGVRRQGRNRKYGYQFLRALHKLINNHRTDAEVQTQVFSALHAAVSAYDGDQSGLPIYGFIEGALEKYQWRNRTDDAVEILTLIKTKVEKFPHGKGSNVCQTIVKSLVRVDSVKFHADINNGMAELFELCLNSPWKMNGEATHSIGLLEIILNNYLDKDHSTKIVSPMIEGVKYLWTSDSPRLAVCAESVLYTHCGNYELLGDQVTQKLLDLALSGEKTKFFYGLSKAYQKCPEIFHQRFEELIYALGVAGSRDQSSILQLLWNISKLHPEIFTPKSISIIAELIEDNSNCHMVYMIFNCLAEHDPGEIYCYIDSLKAAIDNQGDSGLGGLQVVSTTARGDQERASEALKYLASKFDAMPSNLHPSLIYYMRTIGLEWPGLLAEHMEMLRQLSRAPSLRECCKSAMDVVEGRSLEKVSNVVNEQQVNIEELDTRLTVTGDNLENIAKEMDTRPKVRSEGHQYRGQTGQQRKDNDVLLAILNKLSVLDDVNAKLDKLDSRVVNMDRRLRTVEKHVGGMLSQLSTDV